MQNALRAAKAAARLPTKRIFAIRHARQTSVIAYVQRRAHLRCFASKGGNEDKTWGDIAGEAAVVAKDLARKVSSSISNAIAAVKPSQEEQAVRQKQREEQQRQEELFRPNLGGGLVGGLVGRALGKMVQSALGTLGEQLQQAAEQAADVQSRAQAIIETDAQVRNHLGSGVQCMAPVSQSSMTQSINGRVSKVISLVMPVVGSDGRTAQATVDFVEGGKGALEELRVAIMMPNGELLKLDGSTSSSQTIDVEWRSMD